MLQSVLQDGIDVIKVLPSKKYNSWHAHHQVPCICDLFMLSCLGHLYNDGHISSMRDWFASPISDASGETASH